MNVYVYVIMYNSNWIILNIRRRGEIGGSAKKVGKRIKELERLYGIKNGSTSFQGNQYEVVTNKSEAPKKTQEQLAAQMGISVDTLQNYKMLSEMIPELKDLIETNIRQRGIGNPNPVKLGRCIKELERIYGIEHGGDRKTSNPKVSDLNQSDIAEMIGISVDTLNNYKKLTELIPELEDLVDTGVVTKRRVFPFTYIIIRRNTSRL